MLKHSLLIIFRNFIRSKSTFLINLVGLSSGLACSILIFLWVSDELKIDKFHGDRSQLYQVMEHVQQSEKLISRTSTSGPTAVAMLEDFPEVKHAATVTWVTENTLSLEELNLKAKGLYASSDFFRIFSFNLIQGDKAQVLTDKSSIVISKTLAAKLFGSYESAVGKSLVWQHEREFQVSGVFDDIPPYSSMQFEYVIPFEDFRERNEWVYSWGSTAPHTFLLLEKDVEIRAFNEKIADFITVKTEGNSTHRTPFVVPFVDTYLYNNYENGIQSGGRIEYVRLFSIIAIFIMIIACINFMNLSTARASRRLKEIGIKKVVGAHRHVIVIQYLGEAMLMAFLSLITAIVIILLLLPQFNLLTDKQLVLPYDFSFVLTISGVIIFTGLLAGSYPALYLSGFNPSAILKGAKLNNMMGEQWARKGLVVFQFAMSVILIVSVWVVYLQIEYVQNQHLGYERENVIIFNKEGQFKDNNRLETFLSQVNEAPGIVLATSVGHTMTEHNSGTSDINWQGKDPEDRTEFERVPVNYGLIELLDIEMVRGRAFSKSYGSDSSKIIVNEAALAYMGLNDPIGTQIKFRGKSMEIVGVSKDFHFESFHEEVKPLFFHLEPNQAWNIMVKIEAGKDQAAISHLQELYSISNPGFELDYKYLDENYQALYASEQRVSTLSKYFAVLAIMISCLGLFGLATFTAARRTKEIGIRKTLGASEVNIVQMLSGEFVKLVALAIVIALPVSAYFSKYWLANFAFRIELEWWYFAGAGGLTLFIALMTVSFQSIKAALMNPVSALRSE